MSDPINGHTADPPPDEAPRIVIAFTPDGKPQISMGAVDPSWLVAAAVWLEEIARGQIRMQIATRLAAQGPRVVRPG